MRAYEEIGEACAHDGRVLFLDREYGYPLMYHARIAGDAWPSADDLAAERLGGAEPLDAAARFSRDFEDYQPHYFVATDLSSLAKQPDLEAFLRSARPRSWRAPRPIGSIDSTRADEIPRRACSLPWTARRVTGAERRHGGLDARRSLAGLGPREHHLVVLHGETRIAAGAAGRHRRHGDRRRPRS